MSFIKNILSSKIAKFSAFAVVLAGTGFGAYKLWFAPKKAIDSNAFLPYISEFTSGMVSVAEPITIRLVADFAKQEDLNQTIDNTLFEFSPSIDGKMIWKSKSEIVFTPSQNLKANTAYECKFLLGKLIDLPSDLDEFNFNIKTLKQDFGLEIGELDYPNPKSLTQVVLSGTISTQDISKNEEVETMVSASQNGKNLTITWSHEPQTHVFKILGIERKEEKQSIKIACIGKPIGVERDIETDFEIPRLGDFSVISAKIKDNSDMHVEIVFSDPLLENQNFAGLVVLQDVPENRFVIEKNKLKLYLPERPIGVKTLTINKSVKNIANKNLNQSFSKALSFEDIKPALRVYKQGNIMPTSLNNQYVFESVGLKAVKVKIRKIFTNNVKQFFQVNNYKTEYGYSELARVGRIETIAIVPLANDPIAGYKSWKKYAIDLSKWVKMEAGALYSVEVSYNKKYSAYPCSGDEHLTAIPAYNYTQEELLEKNSNYDDYDYEESYYGDDYDYDEKGNPCNSAYFSNNRSKIEQLVMVSDIGLIAKKDPLGNLMVWANDIKTTEPLSNVNIELYDFQQQLFANKTTDSEGKVVFEKTNSLALIWASKDESRSYLKVENQSSLVLTSFDVSGAEVKKGIKGFIYGERGVWRPGDSLYLTFILEDRFKTLPLGHPIVCEFSNPQGQVLKQIVQGKKEMDMYLFALQTDAQAPTGNWLATIKVGSLSFTKNIRIETVMPNRLRIKMNFDKETYLSQDQKINCKMHSEWLTGLKSGLLKNTVEYRFSQVATTFKDFKEYSFGPISTKMDNSYKELETANLDNEGNMSFDTPLEIENASGMVNCNFRVKVFEPSGVASTYQATVPYSPFSTYVGIKEPEGLQRRGEMLATDRMQKFEFVTLDQAGKPVDSQVECSFYKIEWRWWYDTYENEERMENENSSLISTSTIKTTNGKGSVNLQINYPNWGRYMVKITDLKSGHTSEKIVYFDWPSDRQGEKKNKNGDQILSFKSDKDKYQTNEKITLYVPGSDVGRVLLTVESSTKVISSTWHEVKKGMNQIELTATNEMTPNVYISIHQLQPHGQTVNDMPIRMYGTIPIEVENVENALNPVIEMPETLKPEQSFEIKVSEKDKKGMSYSLAIVDEGLLDITQFATPSPYKHFYAKEALGISTWDLYDYVIGAYSGTFENLFSIGGDMSLNAKEANRFKRFIPVVKYLGPFQLDKGETNSHQINLPSYIGSVRVMVVAGQSSAYGNTEKTVSVKSNLMIQSTLPRVLGPEEEIQIPVTVFNLEKNSLNAQVKINIKGGISIIGDQNTSVSIPAEGDKTIYFTAKVGNATGLAELNFTASAQGNTTSEKVNLQIRNANPAITTSKDIMLAAGQTTTIDLSPVGIKGTNFAVVEVSKSAPISLDKRLKYLIHYPYGCAEQTTSSVFPQLFLKNLQVLNADQEKNININVIAAISRLAKFQTSDGGFSFWPGEGYADYWCTSYVGHFLIEAKKNGYEVPNDLLKNWKRFQKDAAIRWGGPTSYNNAFTQAYRLYVLALYGSAEISAMNQLKENYKLDRLPQLLLAGTYALTGNKSQANAMIAKQNYSLEQVQFNDENFNSGFRNQALILEILTSLNEDKKAFDVANQVAKTLGSNVYLNTQEISFGLIAISKWMNKYTAKGDLSFEYALAKQANKQIKSGKPFSKIEINEKEMDAKNVEIKNTSQNTLFLRTQITGMPRAGEEKSSAENISLTVTYFDSKGAELNPESMTQGQDITAEIVVKNTGFLGKYENLALTHIIPSGWEINNERLSGGESTENLDYQDIRDDRIYSFFKLGAGASKTIKVKLTATYLGRFYLPAITVEDMYLGQVNASTKGKFIQVMK